MDDRQQLSRPLLHDEAIVRQRNEDLAKIAQDLGDLKDTMLQISSLVYEQKEDLDKIETHTASAEARVEEGVQELTVAAKYHSSYRKKLCIIIVIVTIIIIGLIMIILWKAGVFKKKE